MNTETNTQSTGADVTIDGGLCKSTEYKERVMFQCTPQQRLLLSINKKVILFDAIKEIDNPEIHEWYVFQTARETSNKEIVLNDYKYGRNMYCPKTGIMRTLTKEEFYS